MVDEPKPFLQIVHISDLHVGDQTSPWFVDLQSSFRSRLNSPTTIVRSLVRKIIDGIAPHDPSAVDLFAEFLVRITADDPVWRDKETWLVDTGDLSTLGDRASLDLGYQYLQKFQASCSGHISIPGNHDAWPSKLPLMASLAGIIDQSTMLGRYFQPVPVCALRTKIPNGAGEVKLYCLDSVIRDRFFNTLARGEVSSAQLQALVNLVDQTSNHGSHDFRLLAIHHPVHYPPARPKLQMSMRNDKDVALELSKVSPTTRVSPLIHLVLSGHTHFMYPKHGTLPLQPSLCKHLFLGNDQCQMVVGTLMQFDEYEDREWPHQCEVLRLHYFDNLRSALLLERHLATRQKGEAFRGTGIGPYLFVDLRSDDPFNVETGEAITFSI